MTPDRISRCGRCPGRDCTCPCGFSDPACSALPWLRHWVRAIAEKVRPYAHAFEPGTPDLSAKLDIALLDGRTLSHFQRGPGIPRCRPPKKGSWTKFHDLADGILSKEDATRLVSLTQRLETVDDITALTALPLTPGDRPTRK
jgi:hypothetical protein